MLGWLPLRCKELRGGSGMTINIWIKKKEMIGHIAVYFCFQQADKDVDVCTVPPP